jgi:hypothetical protein
LVGQKKNLVKNDKTKVCVHLIFCLFHTRNNSNKTFKLKAENPPDMGYPAFRLSGYPAISVYGASQIKTGQGYFPLEINLCRGCLHWKSTGTGTF